MYCLSRLNENVIMIGGDQDKIFFYDKRVYKCVQTIFAG